jgi:F-box/TPR repeat protein Pof3
MNQGYLRCAQGLRLDGKPGKALELYSYALKTLPISHPRREVSVPA